MDREELILGITADIEAATANLETLQGQLNDLQENWDLPGLEAEITTDVGDAEQVKADLEAELSDALTLDATVDLDTSSAEDGLGGIQTKAGDASGAIGQMSSNSLSELGRMAGAGSAVSQGLGDIASNAVQGKLNVADMAAVAGPMVILGAAVEGVKGHLQDVKDQKAFDAEQVRDFTAALRDAGDEAANVVDRLADSGRVVTSIWGEEVDVTGDLAAANITADEFVRILSSGADGFDEIRKRALEAGVSEDSYNRITLAAAQITGNLGTASDSAAASNEVFAESQASANAALQEILDKKDPMRQFTGELSDEWQTLTEGIADGEINTRSGADALNTLAQESGLTTEEVLKLAQAQVDEGVAGAQAYSDALGSIEFQNADLQGATTAFAGFAADLFASGNEAQATAEAYRNLGAAIGDNAVTFDTTTEAGAAQQDALEGLSNVIEGQLAGAYDTANGSSEAFGTAAEAIRTEVVGHLIDDLGLTEQQANDTADALGLTAADYEARFELAGVAEAQLQLGLLQGAIQGLPADTELQVNTLIAQGDYVGARDVVADYYAGHPVELTTDADTSGAQTDISTVTDADHPTTIVADADTIKAAGDLLATAAEPRTALIVAIANNQAAAAALESLVNLPRTAIVNVDTGYISVPSASDIARRIGTVRVPVHAYWTGRIEGSRPR